MVNIVDFDSFIGKRLAEVRLNPFDESGKIRLFGEFTHELSKELYEAACRYNKDLLPQDYIQDNKTRDLAHRIVEHQTKLGALASEIHQPEGNVYEIGCGIALPSISYAKLTSNPIIAIDKDGAEIKKAKGLARKLNVDIEFFVNNAENVIIKRGLNPKDIVIINESRGMINEYWPILLQKYDFTLMFSNNFDLRDHNGYRYAKHLEEEILTPWFDKIFKTNGYKFKIGRSSYDEETLVILASKVL